MAHRNYNKCRKGSLAFMPKKRAQHYRPCLRSFPVDEASQKCHLTAFMGYKAGCTHVQRNCERRGAVMNGKQVVEAATVIDCPPMICVGVAGYMQTPLGIRQSGIVWSGFISDAVKRRFLHGRDFIKADKSALFQKYAAKVQQAGFIDTELKKMAETAVAIRLICHTQPDLTPLATKAANIMEIQINGGSIADKIKFARAQLEKEVKVGEIFKAADQCDIVSITKGRGFEGVITRFGVKTLPKKTRRGCRKVACIGSWHPANVQWNCARAGQMGYFHRTEANKQIFMVDSATNGKCCRTEFDLTDKGINPLGGWVSYGEIKGDFVMIRGTCPGTKKRAVILRKSLVPKKNMWPVNIQWICMAAKNGHGMFETHEEKVRFYANSKKFGEEYKKLLAQ